MISIYRTLSLRYLGKRWFRALLIAASIALGVATLVATQALTETMNRAGLQASNPLAGTADLIISSSGDALISQDMMPELLKIEGVRSAHPRIFTKVKLPELKNRSVLLVGIDAFGEETADQPWKIIWRNNVSHESMTHLFQEVWKVISKRDPDDMNFANPELLKSKKLTDALQKLSFSTAEIWAFTLEPALPGLLGKTLRDDLDGAKPVKIHSPDANKDFKLIQVGTVDAAGPLAALGGNTIIVDIRMVNKLIGWDNKAHRIDVILEPGANRDKIRKHIQDILQGRAEVYTPEEKNDMIQNVFAGMQTGFSLCGVAALVVGLFLVYNVLAFSVAERRHEIGILLSLGASRRQVELLFAGEAALLGLVGSLLGIPLGLGLAHLALQPVQDVLRDIFMPLDAQQVDVSLTVVVLAISAGICTAVAAALVPALTASSEKPAEAVRRIPPKHTWRFRALQSAVSITLILLGSLCILLRGILPGRMGTFGGLVFVLLGALVATPLLAAVLARLVQPLIRGLTGIEGRLAADNLVRSASRTGIVIAALAAGVALVTQTAGTIKSNRSELRRWLHESITADLFVTSGSPVGAGGRSDSMPEELAQQLEEMPDVECAVPLRSSRQTFRDKIRVYMQALDADALYRMGEKRGKANPLFKKLADQQDGVIVSENFALLHHVRTGDTINLSSPSGPVNLKVIGRMVDYSWNLGSLFINRDDYIRHWKDDKVEIFDIFLNPNANAVKAQEKMLKQHGGEYSLSVLTRSELQARIDGMIERIYGISAGQLIVVMCVAALGVVTALLISVLQRRREMGMLRAIGASQVQVVRSVLTESALMGVIGTIIGILVGIPLQWYVLNVIMREEFGYQFALHIPWFEALFIAAAAIFLATLAGLGPALYAVRQRIPEAIAYE